MGAPKRVKVTGYYSQITDADKALIAAVFARAEEIGTSQQELAKELGFASKKSAQDMRKRRAVLTHALRDRLKVWLKTSHAGIRDILLTLKRRDQTLEEFLPGILYARGRWGELHKAFVEKGEEGFLAWLIEDCERAQDSRAKGLQVTARQALEDLKMTSISKSLETLGSSESLSTTSPIRQSEVSN